MKFLCKILLILIFGLTSFAQTNYFNEDSTFAAFWNNRIYFPFDNKGILAEMKYDSIRVVFSGGFFLSGYSDTTLWANGVAPSALVADYVPGKVGSLTEDPDNRIYSVLVGDPPFGQAWQNWKTAVEQGAYFYDGDNNGIYDPVDKNSNGQWDTNEDKPDLLYDATYFTTYNDGLPGSERRYPDVDPLGIEIRQTIFASNQNSILDDVIFIRYSLLYKGFEITGEPDSLNDVIFTIWSDSDIGEPNDDLVGSDTLLNVGYMYNDPKNDDLYFGSNSPSLFKVIVQGPLIKTGNLVDIGYSRKGPDLGEQTFVGYKNGGLNAFFHRLNSDPFLDYPTNPRNFRYFATGYDKFGNTPDPCSWQYSYVIGSIGCESVNPLFLYSGDPVTNDGWINSLPIDYVEYTSSAKFTLSKNEPMDIIVAYVVGRGTDALNSITRAREITQYIHEEYERNFSTIVGVEDEPEEVINEFSLSQNYPNPFNPTTTIKFTIPTSPFHPSPYQGEGPRERLTKLIVYNIIGQQVKTLVNEVKPPGSYEVKFDASQLASGVYFYRLTSGSFNQTKKMMLLK